LYPLPRICRPNNGKLVFCYILWNFKRFMIDPIEKKPLNHFPGSDILSFGTAGVTLVVGFAKTGVPARLTR
jgi:hypothetical protein